MEQVSLKDDMLYGAAAIAQYLGIDRRAVYHLVANARIPNFRLGENVCARKSTLIQWIQEQEKA